MTSSHLYIADLFFVAAAILFLFKFLSWELSRKHEQKKRIQIIAASLTLLIIAGAICGNHYINRSVNKGILPSEARPAQKKTPTQAKTPVPPPQNEKLLYRLDEHRAWIKAVTIAGPLIFTEDKLSLTLTTTVENAGDRPATNVYPIYRLITAAEDGARADTRKLTPEEEAFLNSPYFGHLVFPGEKKEFRTILSVDLKAIDAHMKTIAGKKIITPTILVCVGYKFNDGRKVHRTASAYNLVTYEPSYPTTNFVIEVGTNLRKENLRLVAYAGDRGYAD